MPRRKIREYQAKTLLNNHFQRLSASGLSLNMRCAQVNPTVNIEQLVQAQPWIAAERVVVKPDVLFGKRGKNNLVLLNATAEEAKSFVDKKMGKTVNIGGLNGVVDHFVVEPFLPHEDEYYLSMVCTREKNVIGFSNCGGMEIEENWDKVRHANLMVGDDIESVCLDGLFEDGFAATKKAAITEFIKTVYKIFVDLNFHFLEMNPFTLTNNGQPYPLDMRGELDDCAHFKNGSKWKVNGAHIEFPNAFGRSFCDEETVVKELDEQTGASLKLTVLNPHGRIWGMIAGGGASVIYADTVADLGFGHELGNYGEYSGDPSEEDTYQYACQLLSLATRRSDSSKPRALLIGGAIANFTDIAATFSGIIHALRDYAEPLLRSNMKIFVRRGGPNYKIGLQKMRDLESELHVPIAVFGPETNMTKIVKLAINYISTDLSSLSDSAEVAHKHAATNGVTPSVTLHA